MLNNSNCHLRLQINTFHSVDSLGNGKRSIALNLKSPKGIGIFKNLSNQSDILIDPYRAGLYFINENFYFEII